MRSQVKLLIFKFIAFLLIISVQCVKPLPKYDFIVVGAGAGGAAVTRRLVETGEYSILLLESGGMPKPGHDVPAFAPRFLPDPDVTFQFQSIPQQNADLISNGVSSVVSGRMLGGTTSLNYMWFNRGHPRDWDNWADVTGDETWSYENMLKYFKRVETYEGDFPSDQHGYKGPITVSRPHYTPGLDFWLAAGRELGYPVGDPNGPQRRSFTQVEYAKRNGRRVSSLAGYLSPILNNPNLHILTNTNVTKIVFDGNRAVGVQYVTSNSNTFSTTDNVAYATKEVIISAGAYNSPLILQRSGIGPRDILQAANIPIIKELPAGLNFNDHPAINLNFIINNASLVMDEERDLTPEAWKYFNKFGDGPYSSTRGATGQALISSSIAVKEGNHDWPDLQLCMSHSTIPYPATASLIYLTAQVNMSKGEAPMSSSIFLGRPKSRGSISINPNNIFGSPILDLGWLKDPRDIQMFLDGIWETLRIFEQTHAYHRLRPRYSPVTLPACDRFPMKSKAYWICYVKQVTQGGCHPAGTNKMGRRNDPTAVVDNELRVIGIEGLRVVDGSIMPFIVNANPHAVIYAIAEKASEMILNTWKSPTRSESSSQGNKSIPTTITYYGFNTNNRHRVPDSSQYGWNSNI